MLPGFVLQPIVEEHDIGPLQEVNEYIADIAYKNHGHGNQKKPQHNVL